MSTFLEILAPSFLLFPAVMGSILLGLLCPVVGGFLVLRRSILLGLTLPQIAAAGVAFTFWLYQSGVVPNIAFDDPAHSGAISQEIHRALAYAGSLFFTFLGMGVLGFLDRKGKGRAETRLAVAYTMAGSLTILFVVFNPFGDVAILTLVKGEVIVLSMSELIGLAAISGLVLSCFVLFRRELLLSSFDRELAFLLKGGTLLWDTLLYLLAGLTISLGVIMAGPLLVFGFLVLPPIAARPLVSRILPYFLLSSLLGVFVAVAGFVCAYRLDLPLGPTDVAVGSLVAVLTYAITSLIRRAISVTTFCFLLLAILGAGCSMKSVIGSSTETQSPPFPASESLRLSPFWLAPAKNSTGRSLLLPATNPLSSVKEMFGKGNSDERDTVMKLLRAALDLELSRRGIDASEPEAVDLRLSRFPVRVENAVDVARKANMSGYLLLTEILRWSPERGFVSVLMVVTLVDLTRGEATWQQRIQGALPTKSAVSLRDAHVDAVRAVIKRIFRPA